MRKKNIFKKIVFYSGFIASVLTIGSIFFVKEKGITNTQTSYGSHSPNIIINNK